MRKRKLSRRERKALRAAVFSGYEPTPMWDAITGATEDRRRREHRGRSILAAAPERCDTIRRAGHSLRTAIPVSEKRPGKPRSMEHDRVSRPRPEGHFWFK